MASGSGSQKAANGHITRAYARRNRQVLGRAVDRAGTIEELDRVAEQRTKLQTLNDNLFRTSSGYVDRRTGRKVSTKRVMEVASKLKVLNRRFDALVSQF